MSIDNVLALESKEFMVFMEDLDYQATKHMKVMLEIELERTRMLYDTYVNATMLDFVDKMHTNAVVIAERIGICDYFLSKRGVDLSIFSSSNN